jgi:hypothetical protein
MVFPKTVLGAQVELKINGAWTSVVRYDAQTNLLQKSGIKITRGIGGLQDKTPPGSCSWIWHDPNGIYVNENPRSPYYGVLPRNTPVRAYVPRAQSALYCTDSNSDGTHNGIRASCPDSVATSVVGDIDVRIEFEPIQWARYGVRSGGVIGSWLLCSKFNSLTNNRSWYMRLTEHGILNVVHSVTGNANGSENFTVPIDMSSPRTAVRFTIQANNGTNSVISVYQAPSITGTWTLLNTGTNVAFTSLFDSNAAIELGSGNAGNTGSVSSIFNSFTGFRGRIYNFELRAGINGTVVANADFTNRTNGTASFTDPQGNLWSTGPCGQITNAEYRFHGEFSAPTLVPNKTKNGTGLDVQVQAEAGGLLRRLQANDAPLQSPLFRLMSGIQYQPNGYWAGEDASASDTSTASSGATNGTPAIISDITFNGADASLPGTAGVMILGSTLPTFVGTCNPATQTTETHFVGMFKCPAVAPLGTEIPLFTLYTANSTIVKWVWGVGNTTYGLHGYNAAGVEVANKGTTFGAGADPTNQWIAWHFQLTNVAGTVSIKSEWMALNTGVLWTSTAIGTISFAGNNGVISSVLVGGTVASAGIRVAHINASTLVGLTFWDGTNSTFAKIASGYRGETADARFIRMCQLLGVTPVIFGELGGTEQMGAEPLDTALNAIYECPAVDGGMIIEAVDQPNTLEYWTRNSLESQIYNLQMTWANLSDGLRATPDDADVANDIILTRRNGGSARATLAYGPMSIQAPPNGINPVPDGPEINNYTDARLPALVQYLLLKRTWPTSRYPSVTIQMERADFSGNAALFLLAQRQMLGMRLRISALPQFMAPETVDLLTRGITETILAQEWHIAWACVPYGPYSGTDLLTNPPYNSDFSYKAASTVIAGVTQQQLNAGITTGATSFAVNTLSGVLFDATAVNVPVMIDGELMTVGSISGTTSPQTFNSVIRAVNGVAKAHLVNAAVTVYPVLTARL